MKLYNIETLFDFISNKGFKDENINSNDRDEYYFQKGWNNGVQWVVESIATLMPDMQTEAEPVRHGYWIQKPQMIRSPYANNYYCSECREETNICGNYCSCCGAKMDKEW